jgi:sugar phosphate isomerase/epimerase
MAYQRAFSTLGCPDLTLEQALVLAKAHGCAGLELRMLSGSLDLPACLRQAYGTPDKLARELQGRGVAIVALDASMRLIDPAPADREALLALVPWAEALGVPHLRVFDGGKQADEAELKRAAETFRWWREQRAARGWRVDLMVETHDSLLTAAAIERLLAACPGVKLLWDAHHTWRQGGEEPLVTWRRINRDVVHIHVKDSVSRPDDGLPYTYVPPGEGEFPAGGLRAVLQREFPGVLSLEWERHWHPKLAPLPTALQAAARHGWW